MNVIQYGVLGLGAGAVYGLLALGLIVIRRGSGIINFAQGAVGMSCTFLYWNLHDNHHMPFVVAFGAALILAAVIGAATQLLVMRPLRNQSPLTRMLATLGILISLSAGLALKYPLSAQVVQTFLPGGTFQIGSITVPVQNVILTAIAAGLAGGLYLIYRFTYFGIATTAVTENRMRAASVRINPDFVATVNWMIGSMLAATAGILIAPSFGLSVEGLTLLVIPALAVAVVGRFRSFPIAIAVGLAIGVGQTELQRYGGNNSAGWVTALPFFVTIAYFVVRGTTLPRKGDLSIRLPRVGTGRIRVWAIVLCAIVGYLLIETAPVDWVAGMITTGITAIIVLSVVVVTGYAGQLSLAQYALAGCGAWVASRLTAETGAPFILSLVVGVAAAVPIGIIVGLPALRTRGENLAIATLGLSVAASALVFDSLGMTGGIAGTQVGNPSFLGINLTTALRPERYAVFVLGCFVVVGLAVANVRRSASGRRMLAIRDNEAAAASLGVSVVATKLYAFALSSMIAALGGVLMAFQSPTVSFAAYDPMASISVVGYGVIGGVGYNASAPLVGATLAPGAVGTNVVDLFDSSVQQYLTLASGLILILVLILNANGVAPVNIDMWHLATRRLSGLADRTPLRGLISLGRQRRTRLSAVPRARADIQPVRADKTALRIHDLTVSFGGVTALSNVSFEVLPGSIVGLIGPNGAGKSTLIEAVTGFVRPDTGHVSLGERSIDADPPRRRAMLGIARTFQSVGLFDDLTIRENLLVASDTSRWFGRIADLVRPGRGGFSPGAQLAIEHFGLEPDLSRYPGELSYGRRRITAIAGALARDPSVLLLDEPAAGLSEVERDEFAQIITELARTRGVGVLLVEHDVELVMRTCTSVVALEFGVVIASGSPDAVRRDPAVIRAYLGDARPVPNRVDADGADAPVRSAHES